MTDTPWPAPRASASGPDALPETATIAIVGGGLAGVACALYLARAGQAPILLEARGSIAAGASGRHPGLVAAGLTEPPFRLVHALGVDGARALYAFSTESRELLAEEVPLQRSGSLWVAVDDREAGELQESHAALQQVGVPSALLDRAQVAERLGTDLGPALYLSDDGQIDPSQAMTALAEAAVTAGARCFVGSAVTDMAQEDAGIRVQVGERTVLVDAVLFAANPWLPGIHPFFQDKITPYREQALAARVEAPAKVPFRAQYGYFTGCALPDGRLVLRGARWATQHMEVGEDREAPLPRIQEKIEGFLQRFGPSEITHRWAWIEAMSCDGLPIVGPMPGAPRYTCCAGFNGNQPGLAMRSARAVVDGLLTGRSPGVPAFLSAGRFL